MNLTRLAVNRPVTTLMCCLIVVLLGVISLMRLPIDMMPDMTYPTVSVSTLYADAGPEEVETLITRPLERALASVTGVEKVDSTSAEGSSSIRVRFQWGMDLDEALSDIRSKIERARKSLPEDADPPHIRRYDSSDSPVVYLGLSGSLSPAEITQLAENNIVHQLERIEGVAGTRLYGESRREIHVDVDRHKLESLNLDLSEIVAAISEENVNLPAGHYEEGYLRRILRSHGEFTSTDQIGATVIRESNGAIVRVSDVAEIIDGLEDRTGVVRINGQEGISLYVYKQADANTVEVSDRVRAAVEDINGQFENVKLMIRFDKAKYIRNSIENIQQAALYGSALAIVVLILFLRSLRSTLVIGISMPLSILATFILIYFKGFTLNMVSFGGLALGIGLLVDNSIVVLESIYRKREEGLDPRAAAIEGTGEVASAIVASTITTLIVFVPLLFISGMSGILFEQMAWVVSFSLICSLFASLTLTPVLTAYWIGRSVEERTSFPKGPLGLWLRLVSRLHKINARLFTGVENIYAGILAFSLRRSRLVFFLLLLTVSISLGLIPRIGTEFAPKTDEGSLAIDARMSPGIQLDDLLEQMLKIEQAIQRSVPEAIGISGFLGGRGDDPTDWNRGAYRVNLTQRSERKRGIEEIRKAVADDLGPIPGAKVTIRASREMMLFRMAGSGGSNLQVQVRGHDLKTADELSELIADTMRGVAGIVNVDIRKGESQPELAAHIDRAKAGLMGISVANVTRSLETAVKGVEATLYREGGNEYPVLVRLRESDRNRIGDVEQVSVSSGDGRMVSLKNLVDFSYGRSPSSVERIDQQRVVLINADIEDPDLGGTVKELTRRLNRLPMPQDFSYQIAGDWEQQQESFTALRTGFILAIIMMYMVMASQFESLRDPLLILVAIPLGGVGVVAMLLLTGSTFNVQSFIGLVMLAGIVVNNAIVLIDYMNQLRRSDSQLALSELVQQAAVRRFRPILMTTLTTILAMLPMALGWGEGGELQAPLARVVIGGLTSSTLITLLAIPLLYQVASGRREQSV